MSSDESDESTTAASSPLKSVASSPFKADWSSPIKQADGSSPLRSLASSPLAGSPSPSRPIRNSSLLDTQSFAKRKKYEFYDPVVCVRL